VILKFKLRRCPRTAQLDAKIVMREALVSNNVLVAPSPVHGFGVFAAKDFLQSEVLHESPGRLVRGEGHGGVLQDDVFEIGWDAEDADELSILGLGFASLHNHADTPNAQVVWERSERHLGNIVGTFQALRPITCGEELFIHYGDRWWSDRDSNNDPSQVQQ